MARFPAVLRPLGGPFGPTYSSSPALAVEGLQRTSLAPTVGRFALAGGLGHVAYALGVLLIAAFPALAGADAGLVAMAVGNAVLVACLTVFCALAAGTILAAGQIAGSQGWRPYQRKLAAASTLVPTICLAIAWGLVIAPHFQTLTPVAAVVSIVLIQSVAFAPTVSKRLLAVAGSAPVALDEAASGLAATGWRRFSTVYRPPIVRSLPTLAGTLALLSLGDIATVAIVAPGLPTPGGLAWRFAASGDLSGAAIMLLVLGLLALPLLFSVQPAATQQLGRNVDFQPPALVSALLTSCSFAVLSPLLVAPIFLLIHVGGAFEPEALVLPFAGTAGVAAGSAIAVFIAHALVAKHDGSARLARLLLQLISAPILGLAILAAFGMLPAAFPGGSIALILLFGLTTSMPAAVERLAPNLLSKAAREAAVGLGGVPGPGFSTSIRDTATVGRVIESSLVGGSALFLVLGGLPHLAASAALAADSGASPVAALAGLSLIGLIAVARWLGRRAPASGGEAA